MKVEAKYFNTERETTVKDFPAGKTLWVALASKDESTFPNCELILVLKTTAGRVGETVAGIFFLETGRFLEISYCKNWKAIEANVKIINK